MSVPLLALADVHASYGMVSVLHGISLKVFPGEIVAVIGANGAGKSTTLRVISRLQPAKGGSILFDGREIVSDEPPELVRRGLVHVPEGRRIFPRLTVRENLELGGFLRRDSLGPELERVFSLFPVLRDRQSQFGGTLSGGEQQMLAIGRALISRPRLLLLDEPSMGVAPILTQKIFAQIAELNREGLTILIVEQNAHLALKLASRAYVFETGKVVLEGPAQRIAEDPRVREAYLGG